MDVLDQARRKLPLVSRIAAAVLGGYAFCRGFIALAMSAMYAAGMPFHDAEHLSAILGMLLYLAVFCWAFAAAGVRRVWGVLLVGGALMSGLATLLQRALI
jgi:hypothetical protein